MEKKNDQQARRSSALRAGALGAVTTLMTLFLTSPALALTRDDGDDPGHGLSVAETLGLFVFTPLAIFLIIAALVTLGSKPRKSQKQS
ncbi:hypothetical protein [Streptomyces sp. TS71-3]|uniref:hypothetical protein n=1 Tax=Streptomyces sp. TS71-3 TaxID=2733862 RepID=UPI0027E2F596|nr:hypothetical protein [Streptomyces sp. TS71-3]